MTNLCPWKRIACFRFVGFGGEEGMAREREENESFCLLTCCSVSERKNKR
jgi:hypothetical protein